MRDALCCGRRVDAFTLLESRVAKATATVTNLRETGYADPQERAKVAAKHMQATAARLAKRQQQQQQQDQKSASPPPLSAVVPTTPAPARWQGAGATAAADASAAPAPRADPFRTDDLSWERSVDAKAGRAGIYAPQAAGFITFRSFETASAAAQTLAAALTGRARGMTVGGQGGSVWMGSRAQTSPPPTLRSPARCARRRRRRTSSGPTPPCLPSS